MKRFEIVFDATPLVANMSGIGYYTQELVRALAASDQENIELIGYYFNFLGRNKLRHLPTSTNIKYKESRLLPGKLVNICRKLGFQPFLELFSRQSADVVLFPNYASLPTITKSKRVLAVHDLSFIDCPEFVSDKNLMFLQKWVPKSIRNVDLVVTISDFTKKRIVETFGIPDEKIHVTPIPPVKQAAPDASIVKKYGLENGYILFVGTIEPRKNITGLLKAYMVLDEPTRLKYPLVLAGGKGWHDEETLELIKSLRDEGHNIIQTGYVSDEERSALYKNAAVCVLPSHYEGFGMPVLEAMAHGKAVACSDIEVLHEVAGDAAVYFDQNNPGSIADALSSLLSNQTKTKKYESLSKKHVEDFPTWDKVAKDLLEKIKTIL